MEDPYHTNARPSLRNLMGVLILIFGLMLYAFAAAAIGDWLEAVKIHTGFQMVFYLVAGILWLIPAKWLIRWIGKGHTQDSPTDD